MFLSYVSARIGSFDCRCAWQSHVILENEDALRYEYVISTSKPGLTISRFVYDASYNFSFVSKPLVYVSNPT